MRGRSVHGREILILFKRVKGMKHVRVGPLLAALCCAASLTSRFLHACGAMHERRLTPHSQLRAYSLLLQTQVRTSAVLPQKEAPAKLAAAMAVEVEM